MKKFITLLSCILISLNVFAQTSEATTEDESDLFYINVPIVCVFDHSDAYVVNYKKGSIGIGEAYLPKEWFATSNVDKCRVRPLPKNMQPYMTVIYKNNAFQKAYLNMPVNRRDSAWKVLSQNVDISSKINTDVSSFSIEY